MIPIAALAALLSVRWFVSREKFGIAYLFISHDFDLVRVFCDRAYRLCEGKLKPLAHEDECFVHKGE